MSQPTGAASTPTPGLSGGGATTRYILPYTPPVGNQVISEQQSAASAKTRQAQQSVQITDYTWIEQTTGVGVGAFTVLFDVAFTSEPVVAHGMTLPDFAAEIRADVDKASADAAGAQAGANAYQWTFPGNITIGTLQSYDSGPLVPEFASYKFAFTGINNNMNSGKKVSAVFTFDGTTQTAIFNTSESLTTGRTIDPAGQKLVGYATVNLPNPNLPNPPTVTWQLLIDGQPVAATAGFDTTTTHAVKMLSQAEIDSRKSASAAGTAVGNVLALGGDASAFPLCNVYVKRWLLDNQNNYIGADCIVVVKTFGGSTPEPTPPVSEEPLPS